ncbi:cytochrome c maturation protein CcmE [bacterium]|nr:MAG: cytochrome c maturation protein CcmE [bacterium]
MKVVKLKGPVVTAIIASLAMAGVVVAFTSNASPYVTISQAKTSGGDNLHLAGVMQKDTFQQDITTGRMTFDLKDSDGKTITVEHIGSRPASLMDADKVVAIGALKDGRFVSHDLLVKCPSKYDEGKPKLTAQS